MNAKLIRPDGLYTDGLSARRQPADRQHRRARPELPALLRHRAGGQPGQAARQHHAQGMKQGPMTWHVLLKALADGGRYDQVVKLLTDHNADGPTRTLDQQGTYMWEQWNPGCATTWPCNPTNNESMSHGWGSWGIVDMVEELLGVQVTGSGPRRSGSSRPRSTRPICTACPARRGRSAATSAWPGRRPTARYVLDVDVPANQRRRSRSRTRAASSTSASGAGAPQLVGTENGHTTFTVGSGATHFSIGDSQPGGVGGTVPATLGADARRAGDRSARSRRAWRRTTRPSTTANVIRTAGDAALTRQRPRPPDQRRVLAARAAAGRASASHVDAAGVQCDLAITFKQRIKRQRRAADRQLLQDADLHALDDLPLVGCTTADASDSAVVRCVGPHSGLA